MERYILKYLQDSTQDEWRKRYYDYMKMALDRCFWSMGKHLTKSLEMDRMRKDNVIIPRNNMRQEIATRIKRAIRKKLPHIISKRGSCSSNIHKIGKTPYTYNLLSMMGPIYMPDETRKRLISIGVKVQSIYDEDVVCEPWYIKLQAIRQHWLLRMSNLPFNELLKEQHVEELHEMYNELRNAFNETDFAAVITHNSEHLGEKVVIDIFRELNKPSMELIHGLPGASIAVWAKTDYLLVYGQHILNKIVEDGFPKERIKISGNSKYNEECGYNQISLRCDIDDVLVLTSATFMEHTHGWDYAHFPIMDRSLLVVWLYSIENVLKKNNVSHARLRIHPTVRKEWLAEFVDNEFYEIDYDDLTSSMKKATCCIAQNSTTAMEALQNGVSCLVYEPGNGKTSMTNAPLMPPFDGSNLKMRIANSEEQLDEMIKSRYCPNTQILGEYFECFKPEVILEILSKNA